MTAPKREQMTQWALDCGLVEQRDVDNCIIDALFDDLWRFAEIDLRRFAELAYAAGQTAEREACAALHDGEDVLAPVGAECMGRGISGRLDSRSFSVPRSHPCNGGSMTERVARGVC